MKIVSFVAAFAVGTGISYLNYRILKTSAEKNGGTLTASTMLRQLISIFFLVGLYFLGEYTVLEQWFLLIGGAVGATFPSFFFTAKLLKENKNTDKEDENG